MLSSHQYNPWPKLIYFLVCYNRINQNQLLPSFVTSGGPLAPSTYKFHIEAISHIVTKSTLAPTKYCRQGWCLSPVTHDTECQPEVRRICQNWTPPPNLSNERLQTRLISKSSDSWHWMQLKVRRICQNWKWIIENLQPTTGNQVIVCPFLVLIF